MPTEKDPLAEVKTELDKSGEEKTEPAHVEEKQGEELKSIDDGVKKLCEDVESWKTETQQTLSELKAEMEASRELIRELSEKKAPEPETPTVVAIAPAPEPLPPSEPESNAGDRPAAKTAPVASQEPARKKHRFV